MKAKAFLTRAGGERRGAERASPRRGKRVLGAAWMFPLVMVAACSAGPRRGDPAPGSKAVRMVEAASGVTTTDLEPAGELPEGPPTLWGIVDHLEGNSILVTQLPPLDQILALGSVEAGPTLEVVVTKHTLVYRDVTFGPAVEGVIQEQVAPGSEDEIEEGNLISVWGEPRGDRIVAEVLKYNNHSQIVLPSGPLE